MQHVVSSFVRPAARPLVVLALAAALAAPAASASAAPGGGSLGPAGSPYGGVVRLSQTGPVVVFSETTTDLATGESVTDSSTEERDNQGRVVHAVDSTVLGDGTVEFSQESTFTYGSGDRTEKIVRVFDGDGDGPEAPTVSVSTFTYDQRGNLVAVDHHLRRGGGRHDRRHRRRALHAGPAWSHTDAALRGQQRARARRRSGARRHLHLRQAGEPDAGRGGPRLRRHAAGPGRAVRRAPRPTTGRAT